MRSIEYLWIVFWRRILPGINDDGIDDDGDANGIDDEDGNNDEDNEFADNVEEDELDAELDLES